MKKNVQPASLANLKPPITGKPDDPIRNKMGRPRRYDELVRLVTEYGEQKTPENKTKVMDALERVWKKDPGKFLEYRFGKEPEQIDLNPYGDGVELTVRVIKVIE